MATKEEFQLILGGGGSLEDAWSGLDERALTVALDLVSDWDEMVRGGAGKVAVFCVYGSNIFFV